MTETVRGLARHRAALYSPAASVLAQHRLAQEKSMVRGRIVARPAAARAAYLVVVSLLAACAPRLAEQGVETAAPALRGDAFETRDGLKLRLRHWDAPAPRAVIVALHGMSDYSNAFDMPASWWATQGITTLAYDQRSFGQSRNPGRVAGRRGASRRPFGFRRGGACEISGPSGVCAGREHGRRGGGCPRSRRAGRRASTASSSSRRRWWSRSDMPLFLSHRAVGHGAHASLAHAVGQGSEDLALRQYRDAQEAFARSAVPASDARRCGLWAG